MKTKRNLLLLIISMVMFSCTEENEYTIILKESGNLNVQLLQNETPITNEYVYLIPVMYYTPDTKTPLSEYAVDYIQTDENGNVDFGEVNAGNYYVATEGIEISGKTYYPNKMFQIISGSTKSLTIDVLDYVGTINLTVMYYNYLPRSGVNVAIVNAEDYYNAGFEDWIEATVEEKVTDVDGKVSFTLPCGIEYFSITYLKDSMNYDAEYLTLLDWHETYEEDIRIYF